MSKRNDTSRTREAGQRAATAAQTPPDQRPDQWKGYAAICAAVVIWAGWIAATREQVGAAPPLDLALIRYCVPALLLAPVWLKGGLIPKEAAPWRLAVMTLGWGGPFVLLCGTGLATVPASLFGPLVPAMLPLIVALWDRLFGGVRIHAERGIGLGFILGAAALTLGPAVIEGGAGILHGAPYLLCAAAGWSAFTIAYRGTRLSGLQATAYVCLWSSPPLLAATLIMGTHLPELSLERLGYMVLSQAVLSGICSVACFAYAIQRLGAARTAAFTSLVPVGAALCGWAFLGEAVGPLGWAAAVCACLGVAAVNGVLSGLFRPGRRRRKTAAPAGAAAGLTAGAEATTAAKPGA